jgi:tRNA threonylcarbamoyl adenosine modification protein YeaZ
VIIAIESASTDASVALAEPDGGLIAVDGWTADRRQGSEVLPRLLALLAAYELRLDDATGIAVGIGPGSFTGLRVGLSLGKGIAYALGLPIVGVGSLAAWLAAEPSAAAAVARAGASEAWLLDRHADVPAVVDREDLPARLPASGSVAPAELSDAFGLAGTVLPHRAAAGVATLAAARLRASPDDLATLEPAYLRAPRGLEPPSAAKRR